MTQTAPQTAGTPAAPTHYVKVRKPDGRAWYFLGARGALTRLRVHALMFAADAAAAAAADIHAANPGEWAAKAVPMTAPRRRNARSAAGAGAAGV